MSRSTRTHDGTVVVDTSATPPDVAGVYRARDVGVSFKSRGKSIQVLSGINFDVNAGEIVAIVGRSGTGKTTLLRVLSGLLTPSVGEIDLAGQPIDGPSSAAITVFQDYGNALLPWRTVAKNVGLGLEGRVSRSERNERVREALRLVDLERFEKEYPWRLSGGMQQRVQIARALAMHPEVLLMDEPFGALDAMTKAMLQDELLAVQRRTGATILFITHDLEEAIYLSDRVFVIAGSPGNGEPGHLAMEVSTDLPRPRDQVITREEARYLALRHQLAHAFATNDFGASLGETS